MKTIGKLKIKNKELIIITKQLKKINKMEIVELNSKIKNKIIKIPIKTEIINSFGIDYLKKFVEQQIQFLYIEHIKSRIDKSIAESSVDNYSLLEKARESAWNIYKSDFLKNVKTN